MNVADLPKSNHEGAAQMTSSKFMINGYWGSRSETPESIAECSLRMLDSLSRIDPVFGTWLCAGNRKMVALDSMRDGKLAEFIAVNAPVRDEFKKPDPRHGFIFSVNNFRRSPDHVDIMIHAGSNGGWLPFTNSVTLRAGGIGGETNSSIVGYQEFKSALLTIASAWAMDWCYALPEGFREPGAVKPLSSWPYFQRAWITYLSKPLARAITPPRSAIVEPQADGGLLLAATRDTFDVGNPAHVAAADDILACLAPADAVLRELAGAKNRQ